MIIRLFHKIIAYFFKSGPGVPGIRSCHTSLWGWSTGRGSDIICLWGIYGLVYGKMRWVVLAYHRPVFVSEGGIPVILMIADAPCKV
jgi:hypothetical protein